MDIRWLHLLMDEADYDVDLAVLVNHAAQEEASSSATQRNVVHMRRNRGSELVKEMLEHSDQICHEMCQMNKSTFINLCREMQERDLLRDTRYVSVEEQMRITLEILGHCEGQRVVRHHMSHSTETINRHFRNVLEALSSWACTKIKPIVSLQHTPAYIRNKPGKYYPYFKDCVGAIDGTHIPANIKPEVQPAFRGKYRIPTQNIMAACDFFMRFTYVVAGWEGTTHDCKVFVSALTNPDSHFSYPPQGKYYVVDVGYPNMHGFLAPNRNTRYHVPEFNRRPARGRNEKFNQLHSSLRNIIERTFGVWKARWRILGAMPQYSYQTQIKIVVSTMALHNFIKEQQGSGTDVALRDALFEAWESDDFVPNTDSSTESTREVVMRDDRLMGEDCDIIRNIIGDEFHIPLCLEYV